MSQIAEALASKVIKNFGLKDIIKHQKNPYKNIYEISSLYPNRGIEFKFWRKTWPSNSYYVVKDIDYKDPSHGKAYGVLFWEGKQQNQIPVYIKGANKRGTWRYEVNNATAFLDNGLSYSTEELQQYRNERVNKNHQQSQQ